MNFVTANNKIIRSSVPDTRERGVELPHQDLALLGTLRETYPVLEAHGIDECSDALPEDLDILANVAVAHVYACVVTDRQAIGTSDVGSCVSVCGRGNDAEGRTVLGLCHAHSMVPPALVYARLGREMAALGVRDAHYFLAGGVISRDPAMSGMDAAVNLLKAGGERVVAGRLGLSESGFQDGSSSRDDLLPTTGRPESIEVVLSANHVYFRREGAGLEPWCAKKAERGRPL